MTVRQWGIFVALIVSLPAEAVAGQGGSVAQAKGGVDESGEYEPVRNWPSRSMMIGHGVGRQESGLSPRIGSSYYKLASLPA